MKKAFGASMKTNKNSTSRSRSRSGPKKSKTGLNKKRVKNILVGKIEKPKKNFFIKNLKNITKKLNLKLSFPSLFSRGKYWNNLVLRKQDKKLPTKKNKSKKTEIKVKNKDWAYRSRNILPIKKSQKSQRKNPVPGSFHARHPRIIKWLNIFFFPLINPFARNFFILLFLVGLVGLFYLMKDLPSPKRLTSTENFPVSTQIFDRNGVLLYEIFSDENRIPVELSNIPSHVVQATIAIEDKNFYNHFGFDIQGILRALTTNIQSERVVGGSTITQQLVKNALLTPEKSLKRKAKEGILAIFTEVLYSKDEILEMYLNYISYGGTSVGVEAASQRYFDKHVSELSLAEASLLAGLPQAPSYYSPFGSNPQRAKDRQSEVLRRMVEDGYISEQEAEEAQNEVLEFALSKTDIKAPHFVFYIRDLLYEEYGEDVVEKGGLRVTTSLDLDLQEAAQASLSAEIDSLERLRVGNGAAMVVKPNTGEILSMIGSRDYFDATAEGQVNVTLAHRQPGSSIKPITYATTFQEKTLNPGSILLDIPTCFKNPGQSDYCPKNYTGNFSGPVTIRHSLGNSLNIPAVKALSTIGVEKLMEQATAMGITTWKDPSQYGLSLTLGGGEVRMIDMAQAFSVLANTGVKVPLVPILKVEDYKGKLIEEVDIEKRKERLTELNEFDAEGKLGDVERVMDKAPAYLTSHIMQDNNARLAAFGARSQLVISGQVVSAKTGTTNDLKDNWTVGFTPEFLVITWVGNNDNTPMSYVASGVTGAAPIFNDIMTYVLRDQEPLWQEKPDDVLSGGVCASGLPPELSENKNCRVLNTELYWEDGLPSRSSVIKENVWIKPETGLPPAYGEQVEGLVLEERTIYQDPVTDLYCQDCSRPVDEQGKVVHEKYVIESYSSSSETRSTEKTP
jgi:1A family penicillin-binding protein